MKSILLVVQNLLKPYIDRKDRATQANIAPVETDATSASQAYAQGAQLILNDVLYDVTADITQGDALTVGTNIAAADDITTQIKNHTVTTDAVPTKNSTNPVQSGGVYNSEKATREVIAPVEEDATSASQGYAAGDQLILGGVLYDVTADITQGDALTVGTNIATADDVVTQLGSKAAGTDLTTLSGKAYQTDDTTENTLASNDVLPFYDTSATAKRKMSVQKFAEQLISNPNLLDNPWFTVNQRGQNSYSSGSTSAYSVDRWKVRNVTAAISSDGITISKDGTEEGTFWGYFSQYFLKSDIKSLLGKKVTISLDVSALSVTQGKAIVFCCNATSSNNNSNIIDGTAAGYEITSTGIVQHTFEMPTTLTNNYLAICIGFYSDGVEAQIGSMTIRSVKLEVGEVSTLDMDVAPNYAEELLKCQRYYYRIGDNGYNMIGYGPTHDGFLSFMTFSPVPMRDTPTISLDNANGNLYFQGGGNVYLASAITYCKISANANVIYMDVTPTQATTGQDFMAAWLDPNAGLEFSADL